MNRRMVFHTVGLIVLLEAALLILPTLVSILYRNSCTGAFLVTIGIAVALGVLLTFAFRPKDRVIYAKEGFVITSIAWAGVSAIGALPFFLSGQIPSYVDAFFETVSGFTTTGASILTDIEAMEKGLLFWRSFTHWVGGMGVLVFLMAFIPNLSDRTIHIVRAEMPGPSVGKLLPRVRDTAKVLYIIYLFITAAAILSLWASGMSLFDSSIHAFGCVGTGGFGVHSDSAGSMTALQQWLIILFMFLCGINFNLFYLMLIRRFRSALSSSELWVYFGITIVAAGAICLNIAPLYASVSEALRHSIFQVVSISTTTGFSSVDFNLWPAFSKTVLLLLTFIGACAGSTAGGIKISRIILFFKSCQAEFRHLLHPRSINPLRVDGKSVDKETRKGVVIYFTIYMFCFAAIFLLISLNGFDLETNLSAVAACFNNVGPGLNLVGPMGSFAMYSPFSKLLLSLAMLLGRLEIWPILLTLYPVAWMSAGHQKKGPK
ncbi:MAG: TrkH family potassium uptake protein [Clostridia bacterium]|nr:TrkH family potassium uptake protein [Clostridia bacterium]